MESIYRQYHEEPRYRPSVITAQRLAAGLLGRKTGEGFYRYVDNVVQLPDEAPTPAVDMIPPVWVSPRAARRPEIYQMLKNLGVEESATRRRVLATNPVTRVDIRNAAHALMARDGKAVSVVRDSGGFVTQRVVATIVNIASDICQQRICSPRDLETAVTLGLGYPLGPLAMGDRWGPTNILEVLFNMQTVYGDPRYRPSPWLRRRGAIGLSLQHEEE